MKVQYKDIFSIDLKSLAIMRICTALLIIVDLILRVPDIEAFYTDQGVLPCFVLAYQTIGTSLISLHNLNGSLQFQQALFLISGFFAVLLLIGHRTKAVTIISWILLVSLHRRDNFILSGGDLVLHLILFWSMFLPWGARYSIDSILNSNKENLPEKVTSMGTVGISLQIAFMYWFTVLLKLTNAEWLDGSAVYYAFKGSTYAKPLAASLTNYPQHILKICTYATLVFEFFGPLFLLLFPALRTILAIAFICLQISFGLCFEVVLFPWSCSVAMLMFLPGSLWSKLFGLIKINLAPFQAFVCKYIPSKSINTKLSLPGNILAIFFIAYIFLWNLSTVYPKYNILKTSNWIGYVLAIDQSWNMFVPPIKSGSWPVFLGKLKDGTQVDILRDGKPLSWERPPVPSAIGKNQRWHAYIITTTAMPAEWNTYYFAKYLCKEWNKKHSNDKQLQEIEFYLMFEYNSLNGETSKPEKKFMWKQSCS